MTSPRIIAPYLYSSATNKRKVSIKKSHPRKIMAHLVYLAKGKCTLRCSFHFSKSCSQDEIRSKSTYHERRRHPWQGQNSGSRCPIDSTEILLAAVPCPLACSSNACLPPARHTGSLCPLRGEFRPLQDNRQQGKRLPQPWALAATCRPTVFCCPLYET
jgi:hypothetical protein